MQCRRCQRENPHDASFCVGCGAELAVRCNACRADLPADANFCPRCGHPASAVAPAPGAAAAGSTPAAFASGRYEVKRLLGEGANKRVYLARDSLIDREVAIGAIKTEGLDESGIERVRQEARAMGKLGDHPNIVAVYDVSQEGSQLFLVAQYMPGGDLQQRLRGADGHRLELDEALRIAEDVCVALDHAHQREIVHRDIKPGNVWFDGQGRARLGDFGLARAADRTRITQQGMMVGTAAYMAPEQALGGGATPQSDLYSLGAMLYELLTGRPPFVGDDAVAVISQHINTPPVKPSWHNPAVRRDIDALVLRLLAKDPAERPASAGSLAPELRRLRESGALPEAVEEPEVSDLLETADPYIGRQREQEQLRAVLARVLSGEGATAMVVGEPGIGKTRLTEEFAIFARLRGAQVLVGHCYEGGVSVPYLPFVEAFRQHARTRDDGALRRDLGAGAPEVATLVSEVRRRLPEIPESTPLEGEAERIRLFESVASFLRNAAAATPLVLILDDLHWADKPTLLLLQHLARSIAGERVLLVGTYRDVELERTHPLAEIVAALRHEQLYERVLLRGLSFDGVRDLLRARSGQDPPEGFVQRLLEETEGNPFFLDEVLRHLTEIGAIRREDGQWTGDLSIIEQNIPEGVREVIGRRLSLLDEATNQMLSIASAMPDGFSYEVLTRVSDLDEDALLDTLDAALRARLIAERKDDRGGAYEFTHALIRQTLYGELSTPRRVRLHRQIGEALESLHAASLEPQLPALAHHFFQAVQTGGSDKAVDYSRRAGERAAELMAHEEAAAHFDRALQALDFAGAPEGAVRCELLLGLAQARFRSGEGDASQASFRAAAEIAQTSDLPESLARAALGFAGPHATYGPAVPERVRLIEAALEALGPNDSPLRARLLGRLAQEFIFSEEHPKGPPLAEEAVAVARRLGDPVILARTLMGLRWSIGGPDELERQRALSEEAVSLAEQAGDREAQLEAYNYLILDLHCDEKMEAARRAIAEHDRLADELRQPFYRWWSLMYAATEAMHQGQYAEAQRLASEALGVGRQLDPPAALQYYAAQIDTIRRETGGFEELVATIRESTRDVSDTPGWRLVLANLEAELGDEELARQELEYLASRDFEPLPRDAIWLNMMSVVGLLCIQLRDRERGARVYELLLPYAGRTYGTLLGPVRTMDSALALLATLLGRYDEAERYFEAALAWADRVANTPYRVRLLVHLAQMLVDRAAPGDTGRVLALLNEALPVARELGMAVCIEEGLALKMKLQGADASDASRSIYAVASSVQARRPDLTAHAASDGTVTLMFSDVEGFTEMTERLGDAAMHELMQVHHGIVREQIAAHGGHEVELRGDGFLLAFGGAPDAIRCAVALQSAFAKHCREQPTQPLRVRIGLHTGEAIQDQDKFFGKTVIQAFRIADLARAGEILVSSEMKALVDDVGGLHFAEPREVVLKGIRGTHRLFPVQWD
jgi:class 3 adenylate cyclase/tetratricopeptide (TPR) repeat protein/tRNA A-37 threonylcarbamoyl transferase component Bud32